MLYQLNYWPTQKLTLHLFVQGVLTAEATVLVELELRRLVNEYQQAISELAALALSEKESRETNEAVSGQGDVKESGEGEEGDEGQ